MLRWIKSQHFPPGFDEWCELSSPYPVKFESPPRLDAVANTHAGAQPSAIVREFIRAVTEEGKHWTSLGISASEARYASEDWNLKFPFSGKSSGPVTAENTNILNFTFTKISNVHTGDLQVINLQTRSLSLNVQGTKNPIRLVNCVIGKLTFADLSGNQDPKPSVEMQDCWIGVLVLHSKSIEKLTVIGGGIAQIRCPSSEEPNPFMGAVLFKNVFFSSSPKQTKLFQGSHAYSSLYAHLKKLDNTLMANLMRSHQLRAQRVDEEGFAYVTNWIYDKFSDYGMSLGRPLWWLGVVYILAVICCYNFDYGTLMSAYTDTYVGAYAMLLDENGGRLTRSFLLPLHSIINPFGVFFDPRKLFIPTTGFGSILLTIQGLFSDILLVMTALSVRRRFKTE